MFLLVLCLHRRFIGLHRSVTLDTAIKTIQTGILFDTVLCLFAFFSLILILRCIVQFVNMIFYDFICFAVIKHYNSLFVSALLLFVTSSEVNLMHFCFGCSFFLFRCINDITIFCFQSYCQCHFHFLVTVKITTSNVCLRRKQKKTFQEEKKFSSVFSFVELFA